MFKTEKHLSKVIKKVLREKPTILFDKANSHETFMAEEMSLGHGVADLVISFHKKVNKRTKALSLHDINILGVVQRRNRVSIAEIAASTRTPSDKIKKSIDILAQQKLIQVDAEWISLHRQYVNYQKETIAIEVKLKNWRRALEQAYRYRSFAYNAYVFLDEKHICPALRNINQFTQYNIGLASVSKFGAIDIHHKPERENPFDERLNMLLNENIITSHLSCKNVSQASR